MKQLFKILFALCTVAVYGQTVVSISPGQNVAQIATTSMRCELVFFTLPTNHQATIITELGL